jgi:hypothetical protein
MAYIGAPLVSTNFVLDQHTATAGQTAFTMTRTPASAQAVLVAIDGVIQEPGIAYTISGTTLTTTSGVPLDSKVWIVHLGVRGTTTTPADGSVVKASLDSTVFASQAEQETGTAVDVAVTPGRQQYHPSAAKFWVKFDGTIATPVPIVDFNVVDVTDHSTGLYSANLDVDFSSDEFSVYAIGTQVFNWWIEGSTTAGVVRTSHRNSSDAQADAVVSVGGFGDQ